jgi:hypothetical protein
VLRAEQQPTEIRIVSAPLWCVESWVDEGRSKRKVMRLCLFWYPKKLQDPYREPCQYIGKALKKVPRRETSVHIS